MHTPAVSNECLTALGEIQSFVVLMPWAMMVVLHSAELATRKRRQWRGQRGLALMLLKFEVES